MKFFVEKPVRTSPYYNEKIEVRPSDLEGLGVFAKELIKKNEEFESCPVIKFSSFTMKHLYDLKNHRHLLHDYVFNFYHGNTCIALGYGSMYNHSNDHSNASHMMKEDPDRIVFVAKRDIHPGEEILIHYWKGKIKAAFNDSGTMIEDGRIESKADLRGGINTNSSKKR